MSPFAVHHVRPEPGAAPVLLLHGVFADHHLWDPVVPLLDGLDVTALDSPLHGAAARREPLPALAVQVEQLAALIHERLRPPVVLAGHSWGGMLGLRVAVAHPELVGGLLLANTPLARNRGLSRLGFWTQRTMVAAGLPAGAYGRLAAGALYGAAYRRAHPEIVDLTARTTAALGRRGVCEVLDRVLLEPGDAYDLLPSVRVPVTLVAGKEDYISSPAARARLATVGHHIDQHPGGHMGPREAPEHLARRLRELVRVAAPASA